MNHIVMYAAAVIAYTRLKEHRIAKEVWLSVRRMHDVCTWTAFHIWHGCWACYVECVLQLRLFQSNFKMYNPSEILKWREKGNQSRAKKRK